MPPCSNDELVAVTPPLQPLAVTRGHTAAAVRPHRSARAQCTSELEYKPAVAFFLASPHTTWPSFPLFFPLTCPYLPNLPLATLWVPVLAWAPMLSSFWQAVQLYLGDIVRPSFTTLLLCSAIYRLHQEHPARANDSLWLPFPRLT